MTYSKTDRIKAMAIVSIFETSRPFGDYAAIAVLDDGAGVSYGVNQFTHRSGSLLEVAERYLELGGAVGKLVIEENLPLLRKKTARAINALARNERFKKALKAAAVTREMREAQEQIVHERYLRPAIEVCRDFGFVFPLSLAVVYDSVTHGSWEKIRDKVGFRVTPSDVMENVTRERVTLTDEKKWITEYARKRDAWLASIPRLAATRYRTRFFLNQIAISNWELRLPLRVQGVRLDEELIAEAAGRAMQGMDEDLIAQAAERATTPSAEAAATPPLKGGEPLGDKERDTSCLDRIQEKVDRVAAKYDQVEEIVTKMITRKDAAKSLWTTVVGAVSQTVWALFGLLAGVPREVWLVVAVIAAALMLLYLYRQIELGKIREKKFGVPSSNSELRSRTEIS